MLIHGVSGTEGALFRPAIYNRTGHLDNSITPDGVYNLVGRYALGLGLKIGALALRITAATNALDHDADITNVQEWLGHANIATTRIYDRRRSKVEDSPTFQSELLGLTHCHRTLGNFVTCRTTVRIIRAILVLIAAVSACGKTDPGPTPKLARAENVVNLYIWADDIASE